MHDLLRLYAQRLSAENAEADRPEQARYRLLGWVEGHIDLIARVRSLPRRQCEVISLHYFAGYTLKETALILDIKEGTARKYVHQGLNGLRHYHKMP